MTLDELKESLIARAPAEEAERRRWIAALERLMEAAEAPASFAEIAERLPAKPRYIGPGPWLDAIRDSYRP